jgi:hypothetical protein
VSGIEGELERVLEESEEFCVRGKEVEEVKEVQEVKEKGRGDFGWA